MSLSAFQSEEWMVYMAADQFNRALLLRPNILHCNRIAALNLKAAQLSIAKSAFYPAAEMLRSGLSHLDDKRRWTEYHDLALDICSTLAETEFLLGNHDEAMVADRKSTRLNSSHPK